MRKGVELALRVRQADTIQHVENAGISLALVGESVAQ